MKTFASVLLAMFSQDEMRRFLRYMPGGDGLVARLTNPATPATTAEEVADLLLPMGDAMWKRLLEERPRRAADIQAVRASSPTVETRAQRLIAAADAYRESWNLDGDFSKEKIEAARSELLAIAVEREGIRR